MKKEQRLVYLELTDIMGASLCTVCKYSRWINEDCYGGYSECQHPIEGLSWEHIHEEMLEPGGDCYGFRPNMKVRLAADLVGAVLSQGYNEWFYRKYSPTSVTVYGRHWQQGAENAGKVRIG